MAWIGQVFQGIGAGLSAWGKFQEGKQESKWLEYNANSSMRQAYVALDDALEVRRGKIYVQEQEEIDIALARRAGRRIKGTQIARFSKGGVAMAGTPEEVVKQTESDTELDVEAIRRKGEDDLRTIEMNAHNLESKATALGESYYLYKTAARAAYQKGVMSASSSIMSSLGNMSGGMGGGAAGAGGGGGGG